VSGSSPPSPGRKYQWLAQIRVFAEGGEVH